MLFRSNDTATTEIYTVSDTLSLHDALPIWRAPVLYGGSVTPDNVDDLITHGRIDGFLVGGASLDSKKFLALAEAMKRLPAQP